MSISEPPVTIRTLYGLVSHRFSGEREMTGGIVKRVEGERAGFEYIERSALELLRHVFLWRAWLSTNYAPAHKSAFPYG